MCACVCVVCTAWSYTLEGFSGFIWGAICFFPWLSHCGIIRATLWKLPTFCVFVWWAEKATKPPLCPLINNAQLRGGAFSAHRLFMTFGLIWILHQPVGVLIPDLKMRRLRPRERSGHQGSPHPTPGPQGPRLAITLLRGAWPAGLAAEFLKAQYGAIWMYFRHYFHHLLNLRIGSQSSFSLSSRFGLFLEAMPFAFFQEPLCCVSNHAQE